MAENEIHLSYIAKFKDFASAQIAKLNRIADGAKSKLGSAGRLFSALGANMDGLDGKVGKVASALGTVFGALRALGPAAAGLAAVSFAIDFLATKFFELKLKAAEAAVTVGRELGERIRANLERLKADQLKRVNNALEEATTKAAKASKAFEAMAAAYIKVNKAKDAVDSAEAGRDIAELQAKKQAALERPDEKSAALEAADIDIQIAERKHKAVIDAQALSVMEAKDQAEADQKRLHAAEETVEKAELALAEAKEAAVLSAANDGKLSDETTDKNLEDLHKANLANLAKAEAALADAQNALTAAEANAAASAEGVKEALLKQEAAITESNTGIAAAKHARQKLVDAQKKAADAELDRIAREAQAQIEKEEAERNARDRKALQDRADAARENLGAAAANLNAAKADAAQSKQNANYAWQLFRNPEQLKAVQKDEKENAKAEKKYQRSLASLMRRTDWRTANLGGRMDGVRRVALARERAERDATRVKKLQDDVAAAKKNLQDILDELKGKVAL